MALSLGFASQPNYIIEVFKDGRLDDSVSSQIRTHLLSLTVTDAWNSEEGNSIEITLGDIHANKQMSLGFNNFLKATTLPTIDLNQEIRVWLGYKGGEGFGIVSSFFNAKAGLQYMGRFYVQEINFSGTPTKMTIYANAIEYYGYNIWKDKKNRSWHFKNDATLETFVTTIATQNGYRGFVHPRIARLNARPQSKMFPGHVHQIAESDLSLLLRLTSRIGMVVKFTDNKVFVMEKWIEDRVVLQSEGTHRWYQPILNNVYQTNARVRPQALREDGRDDVTTIYSADVISWSSNYSTHDAIVTTISRFYDARKGKSFVTYDIGADNNLANANAPEDFRKKIQSLAGAGKPFAQSVEQLGGLAALAVNNDNYYKKLFPIDEIKYNFTSAKGASVVDEALVDLHDYGSITLKIPGNTDIVPKQLLRLLDFYRTDSKSYGNAEVYGIDGLWLCEKVVHSFDRTGFFSEITAKPWSYLDHNAAEPVKYKEQAVAKTGMTKVVIDN